MNKDKEVWLGTDSISVDSQSWTRNIGSSDHAKIIDFTHFSVAVAGCWALRDVLDILKATNPDIKIKDRASARSFASKIYKKLKSLYDQGIDYEDNMRQAGFIIATKKTAFMVQPNLSTFEIDRYYATGAGEWLCLGALEAVYDLFPPKQVIEMALQTTCKLSAACSPPLQIKRISNEKE